MNKGVIYAVVTATLWGFLAIALKIALKEIPPIEVTWMRFSVAFVSLSLYYLLFDRKKFQIFTKPPLFAVIASIFLGLNYLGFVSGINYTTPAISQIFIQSGPLLFAISGFLLFKEKANWLQIAGLVLAFGGYAVFYNEQIIVLATDVKLYQKGVLWVLFGGTSWALYAVFQKMAVRNNHPMQLNLVIFGIPALVYTFFIDINQLQGHSAGYWLLFIFLGFNTLVAYGSLSYAFKYLAANKVSVIITANPLLTFIMMAFFSYFEVTWIQQETWSILTILGALIVLSGVVLTVSARRKK